MAKCSDVEKRKERYELWKKNYNEKKNSKTRSSIYLILPTFSLDPTSNQRLFFFPLEVILVSFVRIIEMWKRNRSKKVAFVC